MCVCVCRPSSKAAETTRRKPPRKQLPAQEEEDRDEDEDDPEPQRTPDSAPPRKQRVVVCAAAPPPAPPPPDGVLLQGKRRHRRRWSSLKRRKLNGEELGGARGGHEGPSEESCKSEENPVEDACSHCGLPNHPELVRLGRLGGPQRGSDCVCPQILLCDSCDSGYHTACLRPPLMLIPDGEWFCPPCQHVSP